MSKSKFKRALRCIVLMVFSAILDSSIHAASFEPIVVPTPYSSSIPPYAGPTKISPDGHTIAGFIFSPGVVDDCWAGCSSPFVWSQKDGLAASSVLQPVTVYERETTPFRVAPDRPVALSNDSILLNATAGVFTEPVLVSTQGSRLLRSGQPGNQSLYATAMADDASVIVGTNNAWNSAADAFIWTAESGMENLTTQPLYPTAISGNGRVVAGTVLPPNNENDIADGFYWTASEGISTISPASSGLSFEPKASDFNGSVLVGVGRKFGNTKPLLWDDELGTSVLPAPISYPGGAASDVSGDGKLIVGSIWTKETIEPTLGDEDYGELSAAVWDQNLEFHHLQEWLINNHGLGDELAGWSLTSASAVSSNRRVIAGVGINPNGDLQGWVVKIPEPSAISIAALSVAALLQIWRTQRRQLAV